MLLDYLLYREDKETIEQKAADYKHQIFSTLGVLTIPNLYELLYERPEPEDESAIEWQVPQSDAEMEELLQLMRELSTQDTSDQDQASLDFPATFSHVPLDRVPPPERG